MAVSTVDLANQALAYLKRDTIRDLDGTSPEALHSKVHMQATIEEVIEEYDWPQCRVIKNLIAVDVEDLREWTYAYAVPPDAVIIWRIGNLKGDVLTEFEIGMSPVPETDTTYIFTDSATAAIRYGSRNATLSRFSPQTINLMAIKLASKICMPLTKDKALLQFLTKEYERVASKVKTRMANLEPELIDPEFTPELITVRSA